MNKKGKPIHFGKIKINLATTAATTGSEIENEVVEGGFGTFNPQSGQSTSDTDREAEEMKEVMGFSGFGKKAKQFNIEEMIDSAKKVAQENKCVVGE
jgi:hypothetical protein